MEQKVATENEWMDVKSKKIVFPGEFPFLTDMFFCTVAVNSYPKQNIDIYLCLRIEMCVRYTSA